LLQIQGTQESGQADVEQRDFGAEGKTTSDFATCQIYAMGQALTFLSALWFPSVWRAPNAAQVAGLILFLAGVSYRLWAIWTLGLFLFALVPAIVLRIAIEERVLFGSEGYPEFARKRKRLFPLVW
jgi:protein-S-isoprenylcysteine O-methyltransferase Ste14